MPLCAVSAEWIKCKKSVETLVVSGLSKRLGRMHAMRFAE